MILTEIAEALNGTDPLRPVLREKLEATRAKLQTVQEHMRFYNVEIVLREPYDEELQEIRGLAGEHAEAGLSVPLSPNSASPEMA